MVRALQRAQSGPGRSGSWRDRSWPQRQVTETGPPRGEVRAGRPLLTGSVMVPRSRRGRTEAVYSCIEVPDVLGWSCEPVGPYIVIVTRTQYVAARFRDHCYPSQAPE